ncbi:MAG: bifunctional heptose 7-phosphate kinase/heptose 1-phosphate adenyltransferase, partial [Rhodospirillales bacterium]|nr:bifunctional heptose 7-phosphate kinase/heptose 1-phosphate adenyltransferase [Rhodospirillales bacterium]
EAVRAARLASLPCTDLVVVYGEDDPAELLRALRPDLLFNGADRPPEQVAGAEMLQEWGGRVMLAEMLPETAGE